MSLEELYDQGFAARCEGEYRKAKMYFQSLLEQEPSHHKAQWQMALIKGFEGDFDGSLDDLKRLAEQFPGNLEIKNDLAMTYMMLGYMDEACATFHAILESNPDHENARRQVQFC